MVLKRHPVSLSRIVEHRSDRKGRTDLLTKERPLATTKTVSTIRILVVDDHPVVRAGLASMLSTISGLAVCGAASTGEEALQLIDDEQPDVLLLDLRMPGMTGIELLKAIRGKPSAPKALVLTSYESDEEIYRAIEAGAQGYLLKSTPQVEIVTAIQSVYSGRHHIPPRIAARLAERMVRSALTQRELEILEMVVRGLTNKQIGHALRISENTARNHINSIIRKLDVSGRTEAATAAIQQGLVRMPD
jgi:two-component system NarL family response regulator